MSDGQGETSQAEGEVTGEENVGDIDMSGFGVEEQEKALYDPTPTLDAEYGSPAFWDRRYMMSTEPFDWYHSYEYIKVKIKKYAEPEHKILIIGCGNSTLAEEMYEDGYTDIECVDISRVVIDQMTDKYAEKCPDIRWQQLDVCNMKGIFEKQTFDIIIDKACLDCIYCAEQGINKVLKATQEFDRITVGTGVYICFSYGRPEDRLTEIDCNEIEDKNFLAWNVDVQHIPKRMLDPYAVPDMKNLDNLYWVYVCEKDSMMEREKYDKMRGKSKKGKKLRVNKRTGQGL